MNYTLEYSQKAIQDMDRVWGEVFEASADFDVTSNYIDGIMDAVEEKLAYPKSGIPLYFENTFTGYYYIVYKEYLAFYRIEATTVMVERVLYRRSDYMRHLFN